MEKTKDVVDQSVNLASDGWRFDKKKETAFCTYFIKRKKRQCTHRVSANSEDFCSEHTNAGLVESRVSDMNARIRHECRNVISEVTDKILICQGEDHSDTKISPKQKKMRVSAPKRMANPFSIDLTPSITDVQPTDMFTRLHLPLHIDIGCAKGRCIERMSKRSERKDWNHLGVEIRGRTVEEAMQRVANDRKQQQPDENNDENINLHFLTCNFAASVKELLEKFPRESLRLMSIQFPDPWKRKKHLRRLLVQKKLVRQLADCLPPGAVVYISSDCDNVATWMVDRFLECKEDAGADDDDDSCHIDSDSPDSSIVVEKQTDTERMPKKKPCFRLLSTLADLDSITTPNMFMKQNSDASQEPLPVSTVEVEVCSEETMTMSVQQQSDGGDGDGDKKEENNEVVELCAESYEWFEPNNNPLGELSERELVCEVDWRGVRRCCFMRL